MTQISDKIANLLHDDTMVTLTDTSETMKFSETHLQREATTSDKHSVVLKVYTSDSKEILTLKDEMAEFKVTQATVTTTQGCPNSLDWYAFLSSPRPLSPPQPPVVVRLFIGTQRTD